MVDSAGWTASQLLEELGFELAVCNQVDLEFSVRLGAGGVQSRGRFACWLAGHQSAAFEPIARLLRRLDAPPQVMAAQQSVRLPVRQGLGVAFSEHGRGFRLYLHSRAPGTLSDTYQAWRWRAGGAAERFTYAFHFLPETPSGQRPIDLVDPSLRSAFDRLLAEKRLQQSSGFWVRMGRGGAGDQLDLALPWTPIAETLAGVRDIAALLGLPAEEPSRWRSLPVRHIATTVGSARPSVTLYASAPVDGTWPTSESMLQEQVRHTSLLVHQAVIDQVDRRLPALPDIAHGRPDMDYFYEGALSTWRVVLGPELHYHAGLFDAPEHQPDDAAMDAAVNRAVTELYPFLPVGGRIYDVGCGWGGALAMWIRDLGCPSLGLTISRAQFQYVAALGLPVRWGDAERTLPPGRFDCAILLESLSHMVDKARLLRVLRVFSDRLVMRVNCQNSSPASAAFGGTMQMISSTRLRELLEATGWRIRHWRDRRPEALPSATVWRRRLESVPPSGDAHLEVLRSWTARVAMAPEAWARHNPLIEVVAD